MKRITIFGLVKSFLKKLNEPFPESFAPLKNLRSYLGVGIFVAVFLYIIQPFELNRYSIGPFWVCVNFGLVTIVAVIIFELFGYYVLKLQKDIPSWTFGKWIIDSIFLILFIGICNYILFGLMTNWQHFSLPSLFNMLLNTLTLGIFPIVFFGLMTQMNAYKRNQATANDIQSTLAPPAKKETTVILNSHNNSHTLQLSIHDLLYLESMQNYVAVHYLKEEKATKEIVRNTMKEMENQLQDTPMFRCHRSFIVNTGLIKKVVGNAQGLRLTLNGLSNDEIPVSRNYISTLKTLIGDSKTT